MFRVSCTSKLGSTALFDRLFKVETQGQAIKRAKDYARKKGHKPQDCNFKAVEQDAPLENHGNTQYKVLGPLARPPSK